jgi:nucleotide-binding universal stress UspA family protein
VKEIVMRVLMATDGSSHATAAMLTACRILNGPDRTVDLACVAPKAGPRAHRAIEKVRRRAGRVLEAAQRALAAQGVTTRTRLETGSPVRAILGLALGYEVTVVGARSHAGPSLAGLGPVASRIVEHSSSSVLIARELQSETGLRVLVPVDGSDGALRAIDKLASLTDLSSADVTLIHVVETPWLHAGPDQEWQGYEEPAEEQIDPQAQLEGEMEREAENAIEAARDRLPPRTAVSTVIERGLPAEEILSEAERGEYDLIVAAASGSGDLKHQMLGSVSFKIAWNAPCSVLLVRATD